MPLNSALNCAALLLWFSSCTTPESVVNSSIDKMFSSNDRNRDGCISQIEWSEMAMLARDQMEQAGGENLDRTVQSYLDEFPALDINADGCLTSSEYKSMARAGTSGAR